ncbi:23S rRNA (uracil(1939)-C(5))-methyltransferase RlmD [Acaryochloris marina]|uniref:23S rRNA (uracil(1939)-C(5))-methyltransferase RlmD n=1 Tax=Acaryochloris marina TaxID=155978 RepID=UPI001BAE6C20|nr:23S rRNA (uracil(1939)-C(5))-methyltransferase RlmD [Acaryochloris marina]QUY44027.1 23S rRNA (uracil(1939)-C(5))-methyltransferase RlmD [Acaryochloris marina S15]
MPVDNLQNASEQKLPESHWQQGSLLDLEITDLSPTGDGVGRWGEQNQVVFVPNTVPGDHISVRLLRVKPRYAYGQLQSIKQASPHRVRPQCIVADKCGGCQWQQVDYAYQLTAKQNHVIQALERIGKFRTPAVDPVLAAPSPIEYRNKVTYPIVLSPNTNRVQAGYYRKGSHKLINLNQCPVQDPHFNQFLAEIKEDIQTQDWPIYNEQNHRGRIRHLSIRMGRRTGEILMTLIINAKPNQALSDLADLDAQVQEWLERYPQLVGICLNFNSHRTNRIFGNDTTCIAGRNYLQETFAGLTFQLRPDTFFQVHTEQAEVLLNTLFDHLQLTGSEQVVDLYCGIGTLTLPLAQRVKEIVGIELQTAAIDQAQTNATLNQISNATFSAGAAKDCLGELPFAPDLVLLDPPRKGCHQSVIDQLLSLKPERVVYVSCHSATLARDLKLLCQSGQYELNRVQPVDFFPQTSHVECVAFLNRRAS